jgi:hypothetical protein
MDERHQSDFPPPPPVGTQWEEGDYVPLLFRLIEWVADKWFWAGVKPSERKEVEKILRRPEHTKSRKERQHED